MKKPWEEPVSQDTLTQKIMDELARWQKAKEGGEKGGRPKKKINYDTVQKQLSAGVPFTAITAIAKGERRDV